VIHNLEDFQRSLASSKPVYLNKPFDTEVIMAEFDWHADRSDLDGLALLDRTQEDTGIDLAAVRAWRQGRVRREMAVREIDAVILMDPVNIRYARRRSISMRRATGAGP